LLEQTKAILQKTITGLLLITMRGKIDRLQS